MASKDEFNGLEAKGTVLNQGLEDRHREVLSYLCAAVGMTVYTYDAHGHGLSGPPGPESRALILSMNHMIDDLLDFTRLYVVPAEQQRLSAGVPDAASVQRPRVFLMGYSMGGLTCSLAMAATLSRSRSEVGSTAGLEGAKALGASQEGGAGDAAAAAANGVHANGDSCCGAANGHKANGAAAAPIAAASGGGCPGSGRSAFGSSLYDGLLLTSALTNPLHGTSPLVATIKMVFVQLLSWVCPALPLFKRNPVEAGIRDPEALAAMKADTLWYRGKLKVGTVASLLSACARLRWVAPSLAPVPLYVQHATFDIACSLPSMRTFLARVRPRDLEMHVVEGGFHDLHHDPETPVLLERMVAWLGKRVGA